MLRIGCILLMLTTIAAVGCRRDAENHAPAEISNHAPTETPPPRERVNVREHGAHARINPLPVVAWRNAWTRWRRAAVSAASARTQAVWSAVLADAETAARDPAKWIRAADRALAAGHAERAAERFAHAATLDPDNTDALMGLATALAVLRRHEQALPVYETLLERSHDPAVRFNYAVALSLCERFEQARTQYETLLDADAGHVRARLNLATLLHAQNQLVEAGKHYRILLDDAKKLAPADQAAVWACYGQLLLDLKDTPAALTAFAEAAKAQPDDATAWLNLANVAQAAGRYGTALTACQRAATGDPQNPTPWRRLGELHHAINDPDHLKQAIECWETSLKLDPEQEELRERLTKAKAATSDP